MATPLAIDIADVTGLSEAIKLAFDRWGNTNPKYRGLYKTLSKDVLAVGYAGLTEMKVVKPGGWEVWWAINHNRFIRNKKIRQLDLSILHEVMYHFLTDFARGRLDDGHTGNKTGKKGHAKTKP